MTLLPEDYLILPQPVLTEDTGLRPGSISKSMATSAASSRVFRNEAIDEYRASVYLTRRCDVRCWYCQVPLVDAARWTELDKYGWRRVVDRMAEMGVTLAVNTGGEPFLRQDLLLDTLRYQIEKGIYPVLLTNGRLLYKSERARETLRFLVEHGLNALSVSIDAPSERYEDEEGSVSKAATGKWALDYAAEIGMTDLSFTAVLDELNPQATLDLLDWNAANGGYNVLIQLVTRDIGGTFSNAAQVEISREEKRKLDDALRKIILRRQQWHVQSGFEYFQGIIDGHHERWACWLPGHVVVAPTGAVQLCNDVYGSHLYRGLNLASTPLRGDVLKEEYDRLWQDDLRDHCPGCYMRCHVDYHIRRAGSLLRSL